MKALVFILPILLSSLNAMAMPEDTDGIRIYPASKFILVPESQAHVTFGNAENRQLNPKSIKILVWNIKKGQMPGLEHDFEAIGKDRDLMIVSEGYLNPLVKGIFDSFKHIRWDMGISFLYKMDHHYATGTLIGSIVDPKWTAVRETTDREPFIQTPKCLTMARYPLRGTRKQLLVISIHGVNAVLPGALDRHIELAAVEIRKHDGPVIFAGDFNTNLESKVQMVMKATGDLGMQSLAFRNDERDQVGGNIIDYIFTRGMSTTDSEVLGKLVSSDHKAMLAELAVMN
jgi:endonuclease/exonuclease/phosphatase (EEP) superfamily protein YafD